MAFNEEYKAGDQNNSDNGNEQDTNKHSHDAEELEVAAAIEQKHKEELATCTKEVAELKDACKSIAADFENYKKRVERDRVVWRNSSQAEVLRSILPVIDDFDRAMVEYEKIEKSSNHEAWIAGFDLIRKALDKFLQSYGVTILKQLDHFDPELHEAIAQVDSPTHESGAIVDVVQKGYMFNGQVLRVARVTVAK
jgi:molecular chaperone GrpE